MNIRTPVRPQNFVRMNSLGGRLRRLAAGAEWIRTDGTASEVGQLKGSFEMFADHYQTIIPSTWSQWPWSGRLNWNSTQTS
jgi:hypothetical protein